MHGELAQWPEVGTSDGGVAGLGQPISQRRLRAHQVVDVGPAHGDVALHFIEVALHQANRELCMSRQGHRLGVPVGVRLSGGVDAERQGGASGAA